MTRDQRVMFYGEDVADYGGAFKVTKGLLEAFGRDRVFNTPISEACICGTGCGAAMNGLRPVVELMYFDFALMSSDQISNQAAKWHYMSGAQTEVPLVIRASAGAGKGYGGQHSQTLESIFCHIPGLVCGLSGDALRCQRACSNRPSATTTPSSSSSRRGCTRMKGPVPEGEYLVPLGVADVKREGADITFVAWGPLVHDCLKAADKLKAEKNVSAEVIDLRTLVPLDLDTVLRSVQKTGRCVVASQAIHIGSYTGEIASTISDAASITSTPRSNASAPKTASRRNRTFSKRRFCRTSTTFSPPPTPSFKAQHFGYSNHHAQVRANDRRKRHRGMAQEGRRQGRQGRHPVHRRNRQIGHGGGEFRGRHAAENRRAAARQRPGAKHGRFSRQSRRSHSRCQRSAPAASPSRQTAARVVPALAPDRTCCDRASGARRSRTPLPRRSALLCPLPQLRSLFRISPRAAALAKHCVIDASRIKGTGPLGRVVERDVRQLFAISTATTSCASAPPPRNSRRRKNSTCWRFRPRTMPAASRVADVQRAIAEKPKPMSKMRQIIAQRLDAKLSRHAAFLRHRLGGHDRVDRLPQPAQGGGRALHRHGFHRRRRWC